MGIMIDGGKRVASISDGGKNLARFVDNGKTFSFNTPHATMTDYNPPTYGFSSIPQYDAFRALSNDGITDIPANTFFSERKITGLALGKIVTIGDLAFQQAPLTYLYIPVAETVGNNAFQTVVNAATTKVIMKSKFNTQAEKDRIFGAGHWSAISFTWV